MDVDDAEVAVVGIGDNELGDGVLPHHLEGVDGIFAIEDGARFGVHDVGGALRRVACLHHAAKVAIGDDAEDSFVLGDHGAAEAFGGHLDDDVGDGGGGGDLGTFVLDVEVGDAEVELLAECATRVEAGEVAGSEVATFDEGHREGVAHHQLCGGAGGGGQVVGAGFVLHGGVEDDVGLMGQEGVGVAHDGDEGVAEVLYQGYQYLDFWCVARLGDADDDIAGTHHTEVAVNGIGGMEEKRWCACRIQCRDNFLGDVGTFSDTCDDDATGGRKYDFDGFRKAVSDVIFEIFDSFFLVLNYLNSNMFYLFRTLHIQFFFCSSIFFFIFVNEKDFFLLCRRI